MTRASSLIRMGRAQNGVVTYLIATTPPALPPVRTGDLAEAWRAAREAAADGEWGVPRVFRFLAEDGPLDLALTDDDACCWMAASDEVAPLATASGLSLCLRLLALIDLIARAPWAKRLCRLDRSGAALAPPLLRAAASAPLTAHAGFDEASFQIRLDLPGSIRRDCPTPSSGALC